MATWPPNHTTMQSRNVAAVMDVWEETSMVPYLSLPNIATVFSELYKTIKNHLESRSGYNYF